MIQIFLILLIISLGIYMIYLLNNNNIGNPDLIPIDMSLPVFKFKTSSSTITTTTIPITTTTTIPTTSTTTILPTTTTTTPQLTTTTTMLPPTTTTTPQLTTTTTIPTPPTTTTPTTTTTMLPTTTTITPQLTTTTTTPQLTTTTTIQPTTTTTIQPTTTTTIQPTTTTTILPTTTTTILPTTTTTTTTIPTTITQEPFNPLILEYNLEYTDINNIIIGIPIPKSTIAGEIEIDWGDNTEIEKFNSLSETEYPQHLYSSNIDKSIIQIRYGNFTHFGFINNTFIDNSVRMPNIDRLIKVTSWGDYNITHFNHAFNGATNLIYVPETIPNGVVSMAFMFYDASKFNGDISRWNTSDVTNMHSMFYYATNFNSNISSWKTDFVTNMNSMFYNATEFNIDITNWDTSKVTSMNSMFDGATKFTQNIGKWNISNVTNMNNIFSNKLITEDIYSQILIGWNTDKTPSGLEFNGATDITPNNERIAIINNTDAFNAYNNLKSKKWTFNPEPSYINPQPFKNVEKMSNYMKINGFSNSKLLLSAKYIK